MTKKEVKKFRIKLLFHQNTVVGHRKFRFGVSALNVANPFGWRRKVNVLTQVARQNIDVFGVFFLL
jgi:hypothetical protein